MPVGHLWGGTEESLRSHGVFQFILKEKITSFMFLVEKNGLTSPTEPLLQGSLSEPALPVATSTPTICFLFADR